MTTTATFVIDFGSVENAFLSAELDSTANNEKTSFVAGDPVHFKVSANTNYMIEVTSGTFTNDINPSTPDGHWVDTVTGEVVSFIKGSPATTQKMIDNILSSVFHGNDLGVITITDTTQIQANDSTDDSIGIATISYESSHFKHTLVPPISMTSVYHIVVYITAIE